LIAAHYIIQSLRLNGATANQTASCLTDGAGGKIESTLIARMAHILTHLSDTD